MLPQRLRLRKSADFVPVLKGGRKIVRATLIFYSLPSAQARFGVVVGRKIGGAVERNRVKRVLRHSAYPLIDESRPMDVVVRAREGCATALSAVRDDLASAWEQAKRARA